MAQIADSNTDLAEVLSTIRRHRRLPAPREGRGLREAAGLTQATLARLLGVAPATVSRWETRARHPRGQLLDRYLEVLNSLRQALQEGHGPR